MAVAAALTVLVMADEYKSMLGFHGWRRPSFLALMHATTVYSGGATPAEMLVQLAIASDVDVARL